MKWTRKKVRKIKLVTFFLFFTLIIFSSLFIYQKNKLYSWSTFVSNGQIASQILNYKNLLIFGSNYSKLFFLDLDNEDNISSIDFNSGNTRPIQIDNHKVLAISDDRLKLIDIKNKKVLWQISTPNQYFFEDTSIYYNYVLAGSSDGLLRAYDINTGNLFWEFKPKSLDKMTSVIVSGNLHYFGNFIAVGDFVYLESQDKTLYKLNLKDGSVAWKLDVGETMTMGPAFYGAYLFVGTKSGKSIKIDSEKGEIVWQSQGDSPIVCSIVLPSVYSDFPHMQLLERVKQFIRKKMSIDKLTFYEFHADGMLVARESETGRMIWQSQKYGPSRTCPTFYRSQVLFGTNSGNLVSLSLGSGKVMFNKNNLGNILNPVYLEPKFNKIVPEWLNIFPPKIIVSNTDGIIWSFNGFTGKLYWGFNSHAPSDSVFNVYGKYVFFTTSDGVIYKLNKRTGKPYINSLDEEFEISKSIQKVGNTDIQELTLTSGTLFTNPWREADISAIFTHESGKIIEVPGFFYDQNMWKIRFNPPLKGKWKWKISWSPHGNTFTKSGDLNSETDTSNFYIRKDANNPRKLTVDGKTIFNGLGLGDIMYDVNYNGPFLDDWAIGDSTPVVATSSSGVTSTYRSDSVTTFDKYISTYGPNGGGFNVMRWSLSNGSQPILLNLGYPTVYSILQGKVGDKFVESLKNNNIHLWLTVFGFDVPYKYSNSLNEKFLLKTYIRYIYARYGAYVDIWELANEVGIPPETATLLSDEIKNYDFEHRMVSISSSDYNLGQSDVLAPHWYETEKIEDSDIKTLNKIQDFDSFNKPIVFAEQGNTKVNYDDTSAVRMRIRTWTAFFNNAVLMFWNQSDVKDYKAGIFPANLYLGEQERSYTKILQNFSQDFPLGSNKVQYRIDWAGVRGYGLFSDTVNAAYFVHYPSPFTITQFNLKIYTKNGGKLQWVDPETGKIVGEGQCQPGYCVVVSPVFKTDIAFKINK
jgi:hypothetical protein